MSAQSNPRSSRIQRIIVGLAFAYLLFMTIYLVLRLTVADRFWLISQLNSFALLLFIPLPVILVLGLLTRSPRALLYVLPVLILAVLWLGPRFLPKNLPQPAAGTPILRVMSNNISHFNLDPQRVPAVALAQSPDVIFLQEVQLSSQAAALSALDMAYPYRAVLDDQMRQSMYAAANITYSRLPFVISEQVDPHIPEMPLLYRNVIELSERQIALYNVHLLSPGGGRRFTDRINNYFVRYVLDYDDTARNRQIDALLAFLASEPLPYIVAGDFNTSDFSMTYNQLATHMHDSFAETAIGLGGSWPVVRAFGWPSFTPPLIRIDYLWHSDGLQTLRAWQGNFTGSDHLPVFAEFALGN